MDWKDYEIERLTKKEKELDVLLAKKDREIKKLRSELEEIIKTQKKKTKHLKTKIQ